MKRNKLFGILLLSGCLLSCEANETLNLNLYKSSYDNGKYFESYKENKDSDIDVYVTVVIVQNETNEAKTFNASDFKIDVNNQSYTCKFFVLEMASGCSTSINGEASMFSYISKSSTSVEIESSKTSLQNLLCVFDVDGNDSFTISYQNNILKSLGE